MRCNVGIDPKLLADQHLIAEYKELPTIVRSLIKNDFVIKGLKPNKFCLGKGHINFFKDKLFYIFKRHEFVKFECLHRNFKCYSLSILTECGFHSVEECHTFIPQFWNDWRPSSEDSGIVMSRITNRLLDRYSKSPYFWKLHGETLDLNSLELLISNMEVSPVFPV
jgi:deoxyribonuclease (pyrimidine dimer)